MRRHPQRLLSRPWIRRALPAGVAAIMVVGGTAVVRNNASASPVDTYRTTTVTTGSVQQRLNLTGSAQRVNQVSQGFAVTGTVSGLSVAVGDTVTAGETLATLDPLPLRRAVTSAAASLAKARATLDSDQTTTTTTPGTTGTSGTTGTTGTTGTAAGVTGSAGTSGASVAAPASTPVATATPTTTPRVSSPSGQSGAGTSLAQAQRRVTSAQRAITADLRQASAALARCVPFFPSASSPSTPSPTTPSTPPSITTTSAGPTATSTVTPTAAAAATATAADTTATTPSDAEIRACVGALRSAPTQQQIQRHQRELTDTQNAFMTTVTLALTTTTSTPGTTSSSTTGQSATSRTSASQSATNQRATSQSATSQSATSQPATNQSAGGLTSGTGQSSASRTVTDEAAVTNAEAALSSARADLTAATLKSSIAGTVGSVSLVDGASSQGKKVVIVGAGAVEVTVDVPLASIATVHVGQQANVTPQGATSSAAGSVTSISLLPSATSTTSSATYPVVVLVPEALPALASGSRADVSVLIGTAGKVLTVPNSALTPLAKGQAMVLTLKNGVATRIMVKTGYAGTLTTQITSGLSAGQQVVLADLSTALPSNTTSSRRLGIAGGSAGGLSGAGLGGSLPGGSAFPRAG